MLYLIDSRVLFNTEEYQLSLLNNDEPAIRLSHSAGRVLETLIIAHGAGAPVSRETLFEQVWEKQGLQPSNGNLNQQVSLIRKALLATGLEASAIVTLPKRGLKLNERLTIAPYGDRAESAAPRAAITEAVPADKPSPAMARFNPEILRNVILIITAVITLLMIYFYLTVGDKQQLIFFRKINACDVYILRPVNEGEQENLATDIQRTMIGNIEQCNDRDIVLFSRTAVTNPTVKENLNRRTFLAKCARDARGALSDCLNFYFYNWGEQ